MKFSWAKLVMSIVLVVCYLVMPQYSFGGCCQEMTTKCTGHLLYWLSHANVWHLAANILCLWMIPCELHLTFAIIAAVSCSFLPCFIPEATCGFSGVLFAIVGMSWGRVHRFKDMLWRNKWWLIIPLFLSHVNALLHVYCLVSGWLIGRCLDGITTNERRYSDWL